MELIVQAAQRLYLQPFELGLLSEEGRWDPYRLVAEVQAHKFPMIIVSTGQLEAAFLASRDPGGHSDELLRD